jgi:hypothetical protein
LVDRIAFAEIPQFPSLKLGSDEIYFLPDAALIILKGSVAAVPYQGLESFHF